MYYIRKLLLKPKYQLLMLFFSSAMPCYSIKVISMKFIIKSHLIKKETGIKVHKYAIGVFGTTVVTYY